MNRDYWQLRTASRNYYDGYRLKTRITNRLRALARQGEAYDPDLHAQLVAVTTMKDTSGKILTKIYRNLAPPEVRKFQRETLGIGDVWMARLIGEVGDFKTYTEAWWEEPEEKTRRKLADSVDSEDGLDWTGGDEGDDDDDDDDFDDDEDDDFDDAPLPKRVLAIGDVRTSGVREVWAYCGHGDASLRRRRGQSQEEALSSGNPAAKMIVHQMAAFALRSDGKPDKNGKERGATPYYSCYLAARAHAEALHPDWKRGHVYNHAVRLVGKAILKDLWRVQHGFPPVYGARTEWHPLRPVSAETAAAIRQIHAAPLPKFRAPAAR
jgi:hypothetical protein